MNVRVYVYHPLWEDSTTITGLVVWDELTDSQAGGIVDHYNVVVKDGESQTVFVSTCTCTFVYMYMYYCVDWQFTH